MYNYNVDNVENNNTDWFRYDEEIEYNKMKQQHMRYKHLFDTMFLFTLLYYPPMAKHLLILKTPSWGSDGCIFSNSIWQKLEYYMHKIGMFQMKQHPTYHLRNTSATQKLQIDLVYVNQCKLSILIEKESDDDSEIKLTVVDSYQ